MPFVFRFLVAQQDVLTSIRMRDMEVFSKINTLSNLRGNYNRSPRSAVCT